MTDWLDTLDVAMRAILVCTITWLPLLLLASYASKHVPYPLALSGMALAICCAWGVAKRLLLGLLAKPNRGLSMQGYILFTVFWIVAGLPPALLTLNALTPDR